MSYACHGPCGGPLFASCAHGDVGVANLLLGCQADPEKNRQVDLWIGDYGQEAWACTTTLSAAVGCGKLSIVKLLLRHMETLLPDILHKPSYEIQNGGVSLGSGSVRMTTACMLTEAPHSKKPIVVDTLLS